MRENHKKRGQDLVSRGVHRCRHLSNAGLILFGSAMLGACTTAHVRETSLTVWPELVPSVRLIDARNDAMRTFKTARDTADSSVINYGDDAFRNGLPVAFGEALEHAYGKRISGRTVTISSFSMRERIAERQDNIPSGGAGLAGNIPVFQPYNKIRNGNVADVICAIGGDLDGQAFSLSYVTQGSAEYANGTLRYCVIGLAEQLLPEKQ
jgi:hypothetical protein